MDHLTGVDYEWGKPPYPNKERTMAIKSIKAEMLIECDTPGCDNTHIIKFKETNHLDMQEAMKTWPVRLPNTWSVNVTSLPSNPMHKIGPVKCNECNKLKYRIDCIGLNTNQQNLKYDSEHTAALGFMESYYFKDLVSTVEHASHFKYKLIKYMVRHMENRLGYTFSPLEIIELYNEVKPSRPCNIVEI